MNDGGKASGSLAALVAAISLAVGFGMPGPVAALAQRPAIAEEAANAVNVEILCETTGLTPGTTSTLALVFTIKPGWNLYWRNPGDSGTPIGFKWELPAGVSIGEAQWQVPKRKVLDGGILDYVYEQRAVLLFPVTVDQSVSGAAARMKIKAELDWLVCREACVPGGRTIEVALDVTQHATAGPSSAVILAARETMPGAIGSGRSGAEARWDGLELVIRASGADRMAFFPYESETIWPESMLERGAKAGQELRIEYPSAVRAEKSVRGVVEVVRGSATTHEIIEATVPPDARTP